MANATILVVEDERQLLEVVQYNLEREGFNVVTATDGRVGLKRAQSVIPDLIILDLMLPTIDGLKVCQQLRSDPKTEHIIILMATARAEEEDEVIGFNMGADDYISKPFKMRPLIHRIKALLRRAEGATEDKNVAAAHGIEVDRTNHLVRVDSTEMEVTPTEFGLLWTLIRRPGRAYSRFELLETSRGDDANALERTVDVHIRALRKKLGKRAECIETVRGVGYRFKRV